MIKNQDEKRLWHQCTKCFKITDPDEKICCSSHPQAPIEKVFYSVQEILLDKQLRAALWTKNLFLFCPGPN